VSRAWVRLEYFARTALRGLRTSPVTSAVAVVTIAVSLVLVGTFALLSGNMRDLLDRFGDDLRVTAWLAQELPEPEQRALADRARALPGVAHVDLVTKDEALRRFREGVGRGGALLEGLEENPLPASLEVAVRRSGPGRDGVEDVTAALAALPGISDVESGAEWVQGYLRAESLVRGLGLGLGTILVLATVLIVANTIRLAVLARRDELEILSLVGASRAFLTTPFLLEGALQGAAGGVLALTALYALFQLVLPGFALGMELVLGGVEPRFLTAGEGLGLLGGGALLGLFGSAAAVSGGLRP